MLMFSEISTILGISVLLSGPTVLFILSVLFAVGLTIASVKLHVEQDPRIDEVEKATPGANCGGCGYAGCAAFAKAVVEGKAPVNGCTVGGQACAEAIAKIMGISFEVSVKTRPIIHCTAYDYNRKGKKPYLGVERCSEANLLTAIQGCAYGCLGFGDCVEACKFDALHIENGLPIFDYSKCTSCGACVKACPRNLIELIPFKQEAMLVVGCASRDPGKVVRQVCQVGCIGCGACARISDVFSIENNLAKIDYEKYQDIDSLQKVFEKCPAKMLVIFCPTHRRIPAKEAYARPEYARANSGNTS